MLITEVVKRDGSVEKFSPEKLNKWAEYAARNGGDWAEIARTTYKRLSGKVKSSDIHQTMINVCLNKEDITYSRIAARLEHAEIRRNLRNVGLDDKGAFKPIYDWMINNGVWCKNTIPPYNPVWEEWYKKVYATYMEYWSIAQWVDKYAIRYNGVVIETPHIGAMGIGLGLHGDSDLAFQLALDIVEGRINLPTPALNGVRNGDFDAISCCVITGGDSVDSIGVAEHLSYKFTAKKAGIGIEMDTRSKGDSVKGGSVTHLGKHPIYETIDKAVKQFTQITRGGSATVTFKCIDPEVEDILMWKTQRVDIETRIDKLDYSLAYNEAFLEAVVKDKDWYLFSLSQVPEAHDLFYSVEAKYEDFESLAQSKPHKKIKARELLKTFLIVRSETGRMYCFNVTRANTHTGFKDTIRLSNLCQEICLPTKPYTGMEDLYSEKSVGETAFCALAAINVSKVTEEDYERVANVALRTVDKMIERAPMFTKSLKGSLLARKSIGIGITGLAGYLYNKELDYNGSEASYRAVKDLAETHYYFLLKASQNVSQERSEHVSGVDFQWLPIDTMIASKEYGLRYDWESLRGKPRAHSVLVAHMPTESSAVFSSASNGLYPTRNKVVYKKSRKGAVQFIMDAFKEGVNLPAWGVDNNKLAKYYGLVQDWCDQGISADYYFDPSRYPDEKKPMSELMKEWVTQAKYGNKSMYYHNTRDFNGGSFQDVMSSEQEDDACESCKI